MTEKMMVNITIDDQKLAVPKGTTVYQAAKGLGIEIPIFCYHDRMPPFGACRMCLVEVEKMGKLQTSCTLEVTEGMVIKTQTQIVKEGREGVLEYLLINHPLDCPICDKGGECPLQDNTMKFGPGKSRFTEEKRHFQKPIPLGPVLMLDRERCIVCARCTRFGDVVAGDHALEFVDRGFKTEVGTPGGGPVESKFIGNTISICPVGALTSRVYRFKARPWDNAPTQSTCTLCPVGCSTYLDERDNQIMRTRACENRAINDVWLCDKGWFGYEFDASQERLKQPMIRKNGRLEPATLEEALTLIVEKFNNAKKTSKVAALGGNPLTIEENYLLQKLVREGAHVNHVDHRIGMPIFSEKEEGVQAGMEIEVGECENLSYAYLLGLDLTEEFPLIWLRLKQAINQGAKVVFLGHYAPEIAPHLKEVHVHAPGEEIKVLAQMMPKEFPSGKGAIFVGSQYLASKNRKEILGYLLGLKQLSSELTLNVMEGQGNSLGARYAGMHPAWGPEGKKLDKPGYDTLRLLEEAAESGWDFLYVAGADLAKKVPERMWKEARAKLGFLVVNELFLTDTAKEADVVLPVQSCFEKDGTFLGIDGHFSKINAGKRALQGVHSDGFLFSELLTRLQISNKLNLECMAAPIRNREPIKVEPSEKSKEKSTDKLLTTFAPSLFDRGVRMKRNTRLVQVAKEPKLRLNPIDAEKRSIKDGQSVWVNRIFAIRVSCDERVAPGTAVLPKGFDEVPVQELAPNLLNGLSIEVGYHDE